MLTKCIFILSISDRSKFFVGSILGPLFFSICINDIVNSTSKFNFLMYADDTTLYFNIEDFPFMYVIKVFSVPGNFGALWFMVWQLCCENNSNNLGYVKYTNFS